MADTPPIELTLRTANLPVGGYDQTLYLATSDPQNPTRTVRVLGTITAPNADTPGGTIQRPLDVPVTVTGVHVEGEWITFTHTLAPTPQSLQPVKVYSQDYQTMFRWESMRLTLGKARHHTICLAMGGME